MICFILFSLLIVLLLYFSLLLHNTTLMLLAFVLGGYGIYALVSIGLKRRSIQVQLQIPIRISEKNRDNMVKIKVTNNRKSSVGKAKALIAVKEITSGKRKLYCRTLPNIEEGENIFVESIVFEEMGRYQLELKGIRLYDISGLLYGKKKSRDTAYIQVMPGMYEVSVLRTEATKMYFGDADTFDEKKAGYDNSEIFQVREYQKGDRMQNVHWRLTAKHDELVVKEHSLPKPCPVVLFLDYAGKGRKRYNPLRLAFLEVAAGLSFSIMNAGCPHYIVWYDNKEKDVIRVRVDDEESMFYFIGVITEADLGRCEEGLIEQYKDKFRSEAYIREFFLTEELILKCGEDEISRFSARDLEKSMSETEIVL